MADFPIPSLENKTPLMVAKKPYIDSLAKDGEVGLCVTVPCGMKPGSDVANLSVLGYNPKTSYTGRSPLEAASIGIALKDTDVTLRANLVTLSSESDYAEKTMVDYSGGEISTSEAKELIEYLKEHLDNEKYTFYTGISYRHCLVVDKGNIVGDLTPPHDITGRKIKEYLPKSENSQAYLEMMKKSYELLKDHPINIKRIKDGKRPANSVWFWGEGTKPNLEKFEDKFNLKGGMISAVDLLKGIGKLTGMKNIEVEGATGNYDTNFKGKAEATLKGLLDGLDFIYLHMEAPDECGHHGDIEHKIYSIEEIDKVVEIIAEGLKASGEDFSMLICPDHPTPISIMTHCADPIPYLIYRSNEKKAFGVKGYDEAEAKKTNIMVQSGEALMKKFLNK